MMIKLSLQKHDHKNMIIILNKMSLKTCLKKTQKDIYKKMMIK